MTSPRHAIAASMARIGGYSTTRIQRGCVRAITQVSSLSRRSISPNARGYDRLRARTANIQRPKDTLMALSLSSLTVSTFQQTLGALSKILDKAAAHCEAKKIDQAVLLGLRLAPDMLPFVKQVQLTSDFAKNCLGRLTGEPPKFPDEEKTIAELKARIA